MKKVAILVDFDRSSISDWDFYKVLQKNYQCIIGGMKTNTSFFYTRLGVIIRYMSYFLCPLIFLFKRKHYDTIVAWQQFYGINFAFLSRLLHVKHCNRLIIMTFIYNPNGGEIHWPLILQVYKVRNRQ